MAEMIEHDIGLTAMVVVFVSVAGWNWFSERRRTRQIKDYANSLSFDYIGAALPPYFPLRKTSAGRATSFQNAIAGRKNGTEVIVFDCRFGSGKSRSYRTVVAVFGAAQRFGVARFGPSLVSEEVDGWTLLYRQRYFPPAGRLRIDEIQMLLLEV